jgi:hypothetical protein
VTAQLNLIALTAAKATPAQAGTTALIFVGCIAVIWLANYFIFKPLSDKIKNLKSGVKAQQAGFSAGLQNELDYADYISWTAKNGYAVHFNKKIFSN